MENNAFKRGCFGCKASSFCLVAGNSTCRPDSDETFTILECAVQIHSRIVCACQAYDKKDPVDLF
ncbi:hypothetical protein DXB23_03075 [Dorea sp. OM02-2LB]|nr:hypothetical protein DXB23_03075 [Dorea sp. OM02-2LB]